MHKNIIASYVSAAVIAYINLFIIAIFSGGINSSALPFMVLIIFFSYLIKRSYGNLWLLIIFITSILFYVLYRVPNIVEINEIGTANKAEFNLIFLFFLIVLLGGVFGRMLNTTNERIKDAKIEILQKNNEKAVMLKEIHHRVKNNLQVVNSLLRMQARNVTDENVKLMFRLTQSRVVAMARLHEKIYNTNNLLQIDVKDHLKIMVRDLIHSYNLERYIVSTIDVAPVRMSVDTLLPLSLIVNELVINSLKYAFNEVEEGELYVALKKENELTYKLIVGNNGNKNTLKDCLLNLPQNGIIKTFARQLNGTISTLNQENRTSYVLEFTGIE